MLRSKLTCYNDCQRSPISLLKVLVTFALVTSIVSCQNRSDESLTPTPENSLMDRSIFTGIPCKAPCWYGLQVGISTESNVLNQLRKLSFIDTATIAESKTGYWEPKLQDILPAKLISASCKEPKDHQCVGLTLVDDTLKIISIFPNYEITFHSIVEILGVPDYFVSNLIPPIHSPGCSLSLIWSTRQIIIDYIDQSSVDLCNLVDSNKKIPANLTVNSIGYFAPDYIQFRINAAKAQNWNGFLEK